MDTPLTHVRIKSGGGTRLAGALTRYYRRCALSRADIVVPAHDARILRRLPDEWFAKPSQPVAIG